MHWLTKNTHLELSSVFSELFNSFKSHFPLTQSQSVHFTPPMLNKITRLTVCC